MKGKVVEAALAGLPVVDTTYGIQGLPLTSGTDVLDAMLRSLVSRGLTPLSQICVGRSRSLSTRSARSLVGLSRNAKPLQEASVHDACADHEPKFLRVPRPGKDRGIHDTFSFEMAEKEDVASQRSDS